MSSAPRFDHIATLTDRNGTFEHAHHRRPRREQGYATAHVARLLVVTAREPEPTHQVRQLARGALRFVGDAQDPSGMFRSRRSADGEWNGEPGIEDCWGLGLWGLGTASAHGRWWLGPEALDHFERGAEHRSPGARAMAFAALGAAAVVSTHPDHKPALDLLADVAKVIGPAVEDVAWPWPEPRLTYANAVLPDALIATGVALDQPALVDSGLLLLGWLLERETYDGHLSVTPAGGIGPDDQTGQLDQRPIEVATMAEACARASTVSDSERWIEGVRLAASWFDGDNDSGTRMWDEITGGGYDGLAEDGANRDQGAEATLALISTRQQLRALASRG